MMLSAFKLIIRDEMNSKALERGIDFVRGYYCCVDDRKRSETRFGKTEDIIGYLQPTEQGYASSDRLYSTVSADRWYV